MQQYKCLILKLWIPDGMLYTIDITNPIALPNKNFHYHEFAELTWLTSGKALHCYDDKEQLITPGTVMFFRPEHVHALQPISDNCTINNIMFRPTLLEDIALKYYDGNFNFWAESTQPKVVNLSPEEFNLWCNAFKSLQLEPNEKFYIDKFLLQVLFLAKSTPVNNNHISIPNWLSEAIATFSTTNDVNFLSSLELFYKKCGRTPNHVARECRKYYSMAPSQIIQHYRLSKAQALLCNPNCEIAMVAFESGYTDLSHFFRQFKKAFGVSPSQYRKEHSH